MGRGLLGRFDDCILLIDGMHGWRWLVIYGDAVH